MKNCLFAQSGKRVDLLTPYLTPARAQFLQTAKFNRSFEPDHLLQALEYRAFKYICYFSI